MLQRLRVKNFLLIGDAQLELGPHLNVLSGETGTGKSLLLDALGLTLGARARVDWVGPADDHLLVEAGFRVDRSTGRLIKSMGLSFEGNEVVLGREVRDSGKSLSFFNGRHILQRDLKRLGNQLVEIHGQRQEERFRHAEVQRDLVDLFGQLGGARKLVRECYALARSAAGALETHEAEHAALTRDEEWLRFQLQEIEEIDPDPDELGAIREQVRVLKVLAERSTWLGATDQVFNGPEGGLLEALESLEASLPSATDEDHEWEELQHDLRKILQETRSFYRTLGNLGRAQNAELDTLPALEQRLSKLEQLQRKHRKPLSEILEAAQEMREGLARLSESDALRAELEESLSAGRRKLKQAAAELSKARKQAARDLGRQVTIELGALGMAGVEIDIHIVPLPPGRGEAVMDCDGERIGMTGSDRIEFLARTNPGATLRPVGEIASGGEMARIALALRVALGKRGRCLLTVFDEIDAGLGATAAQSVARRLVDIGRHRQVLLVTHLPVIAAAAQRHFQVWKRQGRRATLCGVDQLDAGRRVDEIARMLSGSATDGKAREHATALLAPKP